MVLTSCKVGLTTWEILHAPVGSLFTSIYDAHRTADHFATTLDIPAPNATLRDSHCREAFVTTKVSKMPHDAERIRTACDASLKALQLDMIPLYAGILGR